LGAKKMRKREGEAFIIKKINRNPVQRAAAVGGRVGGNYRRECK